MRIAIIGAGAGGLAAAHDLTRAGQSVDIYEAENAVGGLAAGFRDPAWSWSVEKYYHHWFASDRAILDLIRELGLQDKVIFKRPVTAVYYDGKFYGMDSIPAWLTFPGLSLPDRLRNLLVGGFLRLTPWWMPLEGHTAETWMKRWFGARVFDRLWRPLFVGKFGEKEYPRVTMAWFWARLHSRTPRLGTFEGGFQAFLDLFAARVQGQGARIHLGTPVQRIRPQVDRGYLVEVGGRPQAFDAVISSTSPHLFSRLVPDLPPSYLAKLLSMRSMGAVVLILAMRHQLAESGIYWHSLVKDAGFPFLALVEHTNYLSPEHFGGQHILYCGDYLPPDHEYFQLTKADLLQRFLPTLRRVNPKFEESWIINSWLFRTPYAQPVPGIDHSQNIPAVRTPLRGLYLASMSQVYPWDRGTNYAVEIGRRAARELLEDFE